MKGRDAFLAVVVLSSIVIYAARTAGSLGETTFDDAFMVARYARHWLAGDGFSWNVSDGPSYGITSPGYLMVVTAVLGLTSSSDAFALTLVSFVAGLLSVAALIALGFVTQGATSHRSGMPLLVAPALLLSPPFTYHSLTGMETTLSLLVNSLLACALVVMVGRRTPSMLLACVLAGFASFVTRPDNGVYAFLLPPMFLVAADRRLWKYSAAYTVLFALVAAVSLIVAKRLFGDYLPLPFYAKAQGFYQGYTGATRWNAMQEMLTFYGAASPFLLVILLSARRRALLPLVVMAVAIAGTFAYYATVVQIMGFNARYYYPSLAFVVLAAFTTLYAEIPEREGPRLPRVSRRRLALGVIALLPVFSEPIARELTQLWGRYAMAPVAPSPVTTEYRTTSRTPLPALGWWSGIMAVSELLEQLPGDSVIAASEYGVLGARFPEMTIIDLVGLHDRRIAHHGFDAGYVLSRQPTLIWLPHSDYTKTIAGLVDHPAFRGEYEYYPGVYEYGIALRKTVENGSATRETLRRAFSKTYPGFDLEDYRADPREALPPH